MASIKCKACNKLYNYRSSELCPKCGAFNRPPRRMRVGFGADGGVELQTEQEFFREAKQFDARDNVCAEEQARKVRSDTLIDSKTLDSLGEQLNKWGSRVEKWWTENNAKKSVAADSPLRDRRQAKRGGKSALAVVVAVSIFASLIGSITESCGSNLVEVRPEPDYSIPTEQVAPLDPYWSEEERIRILDTYAVTEEVGLTEVFEWSGTKYWIGDWQLTGGGAGDNFMIISVNGNEFPEERLEDCYLLWVDWDGTEWVYQPEKFQNGALIFRYLHTTAMPEDTLCWLIFNDFDENGNWTSNTTAVSLVEHDVYFSDDSQDFASVEVWSEEGRKELLESYGVTEVYGMGSDFMWQWENVGVNGWEISENNGDSFMTISVEVNSELIENMLSQWYLLWVDDYGNEWIYHPTAYRDGALIFKNLHTSFISENTPLWLLCEQYETGEDYHQYLWTTAVELIKK